MLPPDISDASADAPRCGCSPLSPHLSWKIVFSSLFAGPCLWAIRARLRSWIVSRPWFFKFSAVSLFSPFGGFACLSGLPWLFGTQSVRCYSIHPLSLMVTTVHFSFAVLLWFRCGLNRFVALHCRFLSVHSVWLGFLCSVCTKFCFQHVSFFIKGYYIHVSRRRCLPMRRRAGAKCQLVRDLLARCIPRRLVKNALHEQTTRIAYYSVRTQLIHFH